MRLAEHLSQSGALLFRWRGYALLVLLPLLVLAVSRGEPVEVFGGEIVDSLYETVCYGLVAMGLALRIWTAGTVPAGTSGRNRKGQIAATLNTTGPYALCRNPLYLGNCLIYAGVVLIAQDLMLGVILALALALYYERIIAAEEAFLAERFGATYAAWAAAVPAFWPRLGSRSLRADLPFAWRTALRREHTTVFFALLAFWLIDAGQSVAMGETLDELWGLALLVATQVGLTSLRHRSTIFDMPGR